jgi:hypothetical protein
MPASSVPAHRARRSSVPGRQPLKAWLEIEGHEARTRGAGARLPRDGPNPISRCNRSDGASVVALKRLPAISFEGGTRDRTSSTPSFPTPAASRLHLRPSADVGRAGCTAARTLSATTRRAGTRRARSRSHLGRLEARRAPSRRGLRATRCTSSRPSGIEGLRRPARCRRARCRLEHCLVDPIEHVGRRSLGGSRSRPGSKSRATKQGPEAPARDCLETAQTRSRGAIEATAHRSSRSSAFPRSLSRTWRQRPRGHKRSNELDTAFPTPAASCLRLRPTQSCPTCRLTPNSRHRAEKFSSPSPAFQRASHSSKNFTRSFTALLSFQGMNATVRDVRGLCARTVRDVLGPICGGCIRFVPSDPHR